ncbi:unnamed protein product [Hymenolepis diminuta]|uniref:Uncharacterized protein n=1 Tax=Hymenolepis diminuta TaxID=6216 RepID=A0A564Y2R4_HYMDI|nr:unnamed protein product [Hymenolepis diminuta]
MISVIASKAPVDYKCKEPEKICLAISVSTANKTESKVVAQNSDEAEKTAVPISLQKPLVYSQTKVPWSRIDLSLAGPIQQGISYPGVFLVRAARSYIYQVYHHRYHY